MFPVQCSCQSVYDIKWVIKSIVLMRQVVSNVERKVIYHAIVRVLQQGHKVAVLLVV